MINEKDKKIKFLEGIIDLMPGHIYWKDRDGVILGCNRLQAKSAGFDNSKELVGKTANDLPWKEQAEHIHKVDMEAVNSGKVITKEEKIVLANGEKAVFISQKVPTYDEAGNVTGVLGISVDITKQKEIERQLKETQGQLEEANK
ncbi:MAG: PAS domain-containing protein, partial [Gammaproteobacteria bacterium]|nr:PAS domain-containing protein [Gammaproteobacteria bacterium]